MEILSLSEFRERCGDHARAVERTEGISPFCSAPIWQIAAYDTLGGRPSGREPLIAERDGAWLLVAERDQPGVYFPFESAWLFGSALVGEAGSCVDLLRDVAAWTRGPAAFCLGGLAKEGALHREVRRLRSRPGSYHEFPATDCMILDLDDGLEAWLARRSRKFRRTLREAEASAGDLGLVDVSRENPGLLFNRILSLQERTYKWREGTDIFQLPEYAGFYRVLLEKLHGAGTLRLLFATSGGRDVAYIFGGLFARGYRGLQMSFDEDFRKQGVGNWLQMENLRLRAGEGVIRYDLGMPAPYKDRWADRREEMVGVFWAAV